MEGETSQNATDWSKLIDFMLSGSPGSLILWGILAYGVWAMFYTNWQDHDGGAPWHLREKDPAKRRSWWDWRRID
jgi:hypothetical protein